ncbi:hypothetical protein CPB83DRAFT_135461 [Crepidotus variabilis]|uniref:Uncharacterized protein n=1 Tax=Crepidotus variabilis TaxID=179855 RepID=A0A9P6E451_9AGAR|nr:hypothetical protein CPB83DRAFT_135461 [Crepidotus variabilis]
MRSKSQSKSGNNNPPVPNTPRGPSGISKILQKFRSKPTTQKSSNPSIKRPEARIQSPLVKKAAQLFQGKSNQQAKSSSQVSTILRGLKILYLFSNLCRNLGRGVSGIWIALEIWKPGTFQMCTFFLAREYEVGRDEEMEDIMSREAGMH